MVHDLVLGFGKCRLSCHVGVNFSRFYLIQDNNVNLDLDLDLDFEADLIKQ